MCIVNVASHDWISYLKHKLQEATLEFTWKKTQSTLIRFYNKIKEPWASTTLYELVHCHELQQLQNNKYFISQCKTAQNICCSKGNKIVLLFYRTYVLSVQCTSCQTLLDQWSQWGVSSFYVMIPHYTRDVLWAFVLHILRSVLGWRNMWWDC